jgi:hypothetical protein
MMKKMKIKNWVPFFLGIALVFILTPEIFSQAPATSSSASQKIPFRVSVRAADGGQLVPNALVTATGAGVSLQAKTDAQGAAVFSLPKGIFTVSAASPAFSQPAKGTFGIPQQQSGTIVFPANPVPFVVTVYDTNNKPVTGANVQVITAADNSIIGKTGSDGRIQLSVPRPLVKRVDVTAPGFQTGNLSNVQVGQGGAVRVVLKAISVSGPTQTARSPLSLKPPQPFVVTQDSMDRLSTNQKAIPQGLSAQQQAELKGISGVLLRPNTSVEVNQRWSQFLSGLSQNLGGPVDIGTLIQYVLREAYLESNKDLQFFADKVKFYNTQKEKIRDEIARLRGLKPVNPQDKKKNEARVEELEEKLSQIGDDAQLANIDLQNALQKQQQMIQLMNNISKMLFDTAMSIIRKIG